MQPNESYQIETLDNFSFGCCLAQDSRVDSQAIFSDSFVLLRLQFFPKKQHRWERGSRQTSVQTNLALVGNVKLALETS